MANIIQRVADSVMNFADIPTTAASRNMDKNPIDKSIEGLTINPTYQRLGTFEYIKFGQNDDIDQVLQILKSKSSTHSGIINRKSKMVAGDSLSTSYDEDKAFKVFKKRAGGKDGESLEFVWKQAANIYETYGAVALLRTVKGKDIVSLKALSPRKFRIGKLDNKLNITHFVVRPTFASGSGKIFRGTERKVEAYDSTKNQSESIIYVKNPATDNDFYGMPNYIGAFNFIEADYKFGVTIHNAAENGFQPKVSATFVGRNMSEKDKEDFAERFKENFHGADKELAIVNFVRREEEMPKIDKLDISNLDKTISVMANLNDAKILTAHSVTNPSLFGVSVAGKLGNSGTELESAYNIFRTTETLPNRKLLMDSFKMSFEGTRYEDIELEVEDISVAPQENRGDNMPKEDVNVKDKAKEVK